MPDSPEFDTRGIYVPFMSELVTALDFADDLVVAVDREMRVVYANEALMKYARMVGRKDSEVEGANIFDIFPMFKEKEKVLTEHQEVFSSARIQVSRLSVDSSKGKMEFRIRRVPLLKDGEVVNVLTVASEETAVVRAVKAREESETLYRDLLENANDLVQSVDANKRFVYVNRKWLDTLGYTREELDSLTLPDILRPDYQELCADLFRRVASGQSMDQMEAVFVAKDGKELTVEGSVSALMRDGKFVASRGIFRDITERKKTEQKLRKSKTRVEELHRAALQMELTGSSEELFRLSLETASQVLDFDLASILLVEGDRIVLKATTDQTAPAGLSMSVDEGICGRTYREGRSYLVADVPNDPDARPSNQAYRSTVSVPIGRVGVFQAHSTSPEAFSSEDLRMAELLVLHITAAIHRLQGEEDRKRTEKRLLERDAILEAVGFVAETLLRSQDMETGLHQSLERLGKAAGVTRVYLFRNEREERPGGEDRLLMNRLQEWTLGGKGMVIGNLRPERFSYLEMGPLVEETLSAGKLLSGPVVELPEPARGFFEHQGALSIALVPVFVDRGWWGFLGFDDCQQPRVWSQTFQDALKLAADTVGAAIQSQRAAELTRSYVMDLERSHVALKNSFEELLERVDRSREQAPVPSTVQDGQEEKGALVLYPWEKREEAYGSIAVRHEEGYPTLALTRTHPLRFRRNLGSEVETVWLTKNDVEGLVCVDPYDAVSLTMVFTRFFKHAPEGVVLFEGIEYVVNVIGFQKFLGMIQRLSDRVALLEGTVHLLLDLKALEEKEQHLLLRECLLVESAENGKNG